MKHVVFIFANDITFLQKDGNSIPTVRSKISLDSVRFLVINTIKRSLCRIVSR